MDEKKKGIKMSDKHDGWKNYETWAVNSWFLIPEHYAKWQEIARQCIRRNSAESEQAVIELAKQMQESILIGLPVGLGVYSDVGIMLSNQWTGMP
jgi:hypothetical protein